tara:strand:- start:16101 stop:16526 length:426 start_codon:yes stop_codon:yes gene_type:complete
MVEPIANPRLELEGQFVKLLPVTQLERQLESQEYKIFSKKSGLEIGVVVIKFEKETPIVMSICIEEAKRGYGNGTDALLTLLLDMAKSYKVVKAFAPSDLGLAAFFWVRMGFHPCFGKAPDGGLWFMRNLTESLTYNPLES